MNRIAKKITAIAMAFTLLGAGTTAVKTFKPDSDTTITAEAAGKGVTSIPSVCQFHGKSVEFVCWTYSWGKFLEDVPPDGVAVRCKCCGKIIYLDLADICWENIRSIFKKWFGISLPK